MIANLACGHEEAERTTICIGYRMKLGVHTPIGTDKLPFEILFFTRMLDAVRCAFK